jgi:hypothetical protein
MRKEEGLLHQQQIRFLRLEPKQDRVGTALIELTFHVAKRVIRMGRS